MAGGDAPGAGGTPDAIGAPDFRQRRPQRRDHAWLEPLTVLARQPDDLACRSERHGKLHRLVQIAADADVRVVALEGDVPVARPVHHGTHHVRPRHREGPRAAMHGVGALVRNDGDDLAHAQLRFVHPGVVLALAPDNLREHCARFERTTDIQQCRTGIHEEHRAEAGKNMVVGAAQTVHLGVGGEETDIADARRTGVFLAGADEALGTVDADRVARGPHGAGQALGAVAEATPDVKDARAGRVQPPREHRVTGTCDTGGQQVLEAREFLEQYRVPGFNDDVVFTHGDPLKGTGPLSLTRAWPAGHAGGAGRASGMQAYRARQRPDENDGADEGDAPEAVLGFHRYVPVVLL